MTTISGGVRITSTRSKQPSTSLGLTNAILLADFHPKGAVSQAYGVYRDQNGFSGRASFVIDKQGIVRGRALTETPAEIPDEEEYFAALAACPV